MRCGHCKTDLPDDSFTFGVLARGRGRCKPCAKAYSAEHYRANREKYLAGMTANRLMKSFGITPGDYARLLEQQGGQCAICGATEGWYHPGAGRRKKLSVDHCHEGGQVRGLLCDMCNMGIGRFNHDPDLLRKAIAYLTVRDD